MSLRRIIALLVLALDAYVLFRVAPNLGMLEPVAYLNGALVGIVALGVLIFNLPLTRQRRTESQNDRTDEGYDGNHRVAGLVGILVLVIAPLLVAARGVYLGVLPSFLRPRGPDISFSETPGRFTLNLLAYAVWGLTFLFLILRGRRSRRLAQSGIDVTSDDRNV